MSFLHPNWPDVFFRSLAYVILAFAVFGMAGVIWLILGSK